MELARKPANERYHAPIMSTFLQRFEEERERLGLAKDRDFAEKVGVSAPYLSELRTLKKLPRVETFLGWMDKAEFPPAAVNELVLLLAEEHVARDPDVLPFVDHLRSQLREARASRRRLAKLLRDRGLEIPAEFDL